MKQDDATFVANTAELLRAHGYTVTPPAATPQPEPETYTAEEVWEKMEQGWVVYPADDPSFPGYIIDGSGNAAYEDGDTDCGCDEGMAGWVDDDRFTLSHIHPDAHEYAMQRHLAAGLVVGSRVEVVHHEQGEGARYWQGSTPVSSQHTVVEIRSGSSSLGLDNDKYVPAHCLRLLPAESAEPDEPYTPPCDAPVGFEWAGEARLPKKGEPYADVICCKAQASIATFDFECNPQHILRKLPDEPAFKPGDRAWVEVEVAEDVEDDGEVMVLVPRRDDIGSGTTCIYALASALRPAPPAAEGVGE
jgi:hypothetical protein